MTKPSSLLTLMFSAFLLTASGCNGDGKKASETDSIINLSSTEIDFGEEDVIIGRPLSMTKVGDALLILDNKIDSLFHIIDVATPHYVGQFGTRGNGPADFGNIILISKIPGQDKKFGILDASKKTYYACDLSLADSLHYHRGKGVELKDSWFVSPLANGLYVSSNGYVDWPETFTLYSSDGKIIGRYGDRMVPGKYKDLPAISLTAAYQYSLEVSPDGKKIAAIGSMADAAGFYKLEGDSLKLVSQYCEYMGEQQFDLESGEYLGVSGETPTGIIDSASDKDYVYMLVSELTMDASEKGADPWSANVVKVYDWDGNKKKELHLDKRVRLITAPDPEGRMFAITSEGCDPTLIFFKE